MDEDVPLEVTRRSLHAVAAGVISPLRVQATGNEIALRVRPGGFGTPELPGGGWVGVSGTELVCVDGDGGDRRTAITTLPAAAAFVGLAVPEDLSDVPLEVYAGAASVLADVWADGEEALMALVEAAPAAVAAAPINLWPEHFDIATELGAEAAGQRATYGVSPGDDDHPEPYAYVAPWAAPAKTGPATFWNAVAFTGAERPADEPEVMLAFFREAHRLLTSDEGV